MTKKECLDKVCTDCVRCTLCDYQGRLQNCSLRKAASLAWDAALETYSAELEQMYQKRLGRILGVLKECQEYCLELAQENNELRKQNRK